MSFGTTDDLAERLAHVIAGADARRVVWVVGSGLSSPIVPGTEQMIEKFIAGLRGDASECPVSDLAGRYRYWANRLKLRRGPSALAQVVRAAVLASAGDPQPGNTLSFEDAAWVTTPQQQALAAIVDLIPEQQRGPIFTTNFDPLTEVALYRAGIRPSVIFGSGVAPFGTGAAVGEIPVIHLHGFWERGHLLNTSEELEFSRDAIESQITSLLDSSIVICVGYGGWEDSFSRALTRFVTSSQMNYADSEIVWAHHREPNDQGVVAQMRGLAALTEYRDVNIATLASTIAREVSNLRLPQIPSSPGLALVPPGDLTAATNAEVLRFVQGSNPTTAVAAIAPLLEASRDLRTRVLSQGQTDAVHVAVGPTGEGKSLALHQTALAVAQGLATQDAVSVFLGQGAQVPGQDVLKEFRRRFATTYLFVDEADLVLERLLESVRGSDDDAKGRVVLVLAMHAQYAHKVTWARERASELWTETQFGGVTESDALQVADFWLTQHTVPEHRKGSSTAELAALITDESRGIGDRSLFGAVLRMYDSEQLHSRVAELLQRLDRMKLGDVSFRRLFEAIALVHDAWNDGEDPFFQGFPESALGLWCGVRSADVTRLVLRPLGREAAIALVGTDVFTRHPAIARAVIEQLAPADLELLASQLGALGGAMRASGEHPRDHRVLAMLCQHLRGTPAVMSAEAAFRKSGLLESRVTYLNVLRREERHDDAHSYAAAAAAHLEEFPDFDSAARGFFVEWSVNERTMGNYSDSVAIACHSLSDEIGATLSIEHARYGLVSAATSLSKLAQSNVNVSRMLLDCRDMLVLLPPQAESAWLTQNHRPSLRSIDVITRDFTRRVRERERYADLPANHFGQLQEALRVALSRREIRH